MIVFWNADVVGPAGAAMGRVPLTSSGLPLGG